MFFVMPALRMALWLLALCCAPTVAVRDGDYDLQRGSAGRDTNILRRDLDLHGGLGEPQELESDFHVVAANVVLSRRASARTGASVGAQASAIGSALLAEDPASSSMCTCVEWNTRSYVQTTRFVTVEKDTTGSECSEQCHVACHDDLRNRMTPSDATALEWDGDELTSTVAAAACYRGGKCMCLNSKLAVENKNGYGFWQKVQKLWKDKTYDGTEECLKSCDCTSHPGTPFCMGRWNWSWWFLAQSQNQKCESAEVGKVAGIGLFSCNYTQQFKFTVRNGQYDGELVQLDDGHGHVVEGVDSEVLKFDPPSSSLPLSDRKCAVTVGHGNEEKDSWAARLHTVASRMWLWDVVDVHNKVRYRVNQMKVEPVKASSWEVVKTIGDETAVVYWVFGDKDKWSEEKGFQFEFYKDKEKKGGSAAKLERKWAEVSGGVVDPDTSYFNVTVKPEEDAGLILMASVLIEKAFTKKQRTR